MESLQTLGRWITENESLLSGAAAILAVIGVLVSLVALLLRHVGRVRRTDPDAGEVAGEHLSLRDLTAPAPYPIQYAISDGLRIAYARIGSGPPTILMAPGIISHLNISSHLPPIRDTAAAIGQFSEIVTFDKRGQGLSDRCVNVPNLDERVHDIEAVLDACGLDKLFMYGLSEGGPMCIRFAVDHPDRVQGLILVSTAARWMQGVDFPGGLEEAALDKCVKAWGTGGLRQVFFPSISRETMSDDTYRAFERLVASRTSVRQIIDYMKDTDVRDLLPRVTCPTLVIHFSGDLVVPVRLGRSLAEGIADAEFIEVPGTDHADLASAPQAIAAIRGFMARVPS